MSKLKKPIETWRVTKMMDENSNEASGSGVMPAAPVAGDEDWRAHILPGARQRVVDRIMQNLMRNLPFSGVEDLQLLNKIAVMLEERSYAAAINLQDYFKTTCVKMYTLLETITQNPAKFLVSKAASNTQNPHQLVSGAEVEAARGEGEEVGDWRIQLLPYTRYNIVNTMMDSLKKHIPYFGAEGMQERYELAVKLEGEIYAVATSKLDYLRKISTKMMVMETKTSRHFMISLRPSSENVIPNFQDPACALSWKSIWIAIPYHAIWGNAVNAMDMEGSGESRQRMASKIVEALMEYPAFSVPDENNELEKIADIFIEKIFAATMQPDFVSDIPKEIFAMEIKLRNPMANSGQSQGEQSNRRCEDPAYLLMLREIDTRKRY